MKTPKKQQQRRHFIYRLMVEVSNDDYDYDYNNNNNNNNSVC